MNRNGTTGEVSIDVAVSIFVMHSLVYASPNKTFNCRCVLYTHKNKYINVNWKYFGMDIPSKLPSAVALKFE